MFRSLTILSVLLFSSVLPTPAISADYINPTTGMEFLFIKGGSFFMGDPTNKDNAASPAHEVTVSDFHMGKFEVTFAQYDIFCEATGRDKPDDEGWGRDTRPVINVSWHDAQDFINWMNMNAEQGESFRLPSESEWEYAIRGGTTTEYWWGEKSDKSQANCLDCLSKDKNKTSPTGSFKPNPYGLYDMTGNVYEWCQNELKGDYKGNFPGRPDVPYASDDKVWRITRSGSWRHPAIEFVSYRRCWDPSSSRNDDLGFRIALDVASK